MLDLITLATMAARARPRVTEGRVRCARDERKESILPVRRLSTA